MARRTVEVEGYTYECRWLSNRPNLLLHVAGPLESTRPIRGAYDLAADEWFEAPAGRRAARSLRWWRAANQLVTAYKVATGALCPCGSDWLTETGADTVSCAEAYFTLDDAGVPVAEYGPGICLDDITDPDLRATARHWLGSHHEATS